MCPKPPHPRCKELDYKLCMKAADSMSCLSAIRFVIRGCCKVAGLRWDSEGLVYSRFII